MAPPTSKEGDEKEPTDDRGIAFGKAIGDDAFYGDSQEYVSELPTMDEERKEAEELDDEGRVSSHPSTMAATRRDVSSSSTLDCEIADMHSAARQAHLLTHSYTRRKRTTRLRTPKTAQVWSILELPTVRVITRHDATIEHCKMMACPTKMP